MQQVSKLAGAYDLRDWGVSGLKDNSVDDAPALQRCIDELTGSHQPEGKIGNTGAHILIPDRITIGQTIKLNQVGITFSGNHGFTNERNAYGSLQEWEGNSSVVRWIGPPDVAMFDYRNTLECTWHRVRFEGDVNNKPLAAHHFVNTPGVVEGIGTNRGGTFVDCSFGRFSWSSQGINNQGDLQNGILIDGDNGNNDKNRLYRCLFRYCDVGYNQPNSQSVWNDLIDAEFYFCGTGIRSAAHVNGRNVNMQNCTLGYDLFSTACAHITVGSDERNAQLARLVGDSSLYISGGYSQPASPFASPNWIDGTGITGSQSSVCLEHRRFDNNGQAGTVQGKINVPNSDLILENNRFYGMVEADML